MRFDKSLPSLESHMDGLMVEIGNHVLNPPANDPYLRAFAHSCGRLVVENSQVKDRFLNLFYEYEVSGRSPPSTEVLAKTQRAVQKRQLQKMENDEIENYPVGFENAARWDEPILETLSIAGRE